MPQRYKLRLGDGTVLSVDMDGLRAWVQDRQAVAQAVGSQQWRPLKDVLAEEENAARLLRALIPPKPKKESPPPPSAPPAPVTPTPPFDDPHSLGDATPPYLEPVSYTPPAFGHPLGFGEPAFGDPAPFTFDEPSPVGEPSPISEHAPVSEPAPVNDLAPFTPAPAFSEPSFREPAAAAPRQSLQVLADDTTSAGSSDASDPALPPIRMKPLDDEREFRSAWDEGAEVDEPDEPPSEHLQGPLLTLLEPLGRFLSRMLAPLAPVLNRLTSRSPRATESSSPRFSDSPFPPIDMGASAGPRLGERLAAGWSGVVAGWNGLVAGLGGLAARLRRAPSTDESEPEEEPEPEEPQPVRAPLPPRVSAPLEPVAPRQPAQAFQPAPPRQPVAPPAPLSSIPVLPLADAVGPREAEDVYEEDEPSDFFGPLWFWTKRLVVLGALAAAGIYAYQEREEWFPRTADVGQTVFRAIDRQAHARERAQQLQQALAEATPKLPHLTPETILLVFAESPTGVMAAPDVFQLTREAAERGLGTLSPDDAEELRALESELAATLRPPERRRLEEYDQARSRRGVFPFENPYAMDLVAKGARGLPAARLERLRALTQQAVAAGLTIPPAEP